MFLELMQAATAAVQHAPSPNDVTEVVPYLTSAATIAYLQKWLKTLRLYARFVEKFPGADKYAHWFAAAVMSFLAAEGIHFVWTGTLVAGGVLTVTIPSVATLLHSAADFFKVYVLQATVYDATKQKPAPNP